jgi:predicted nuclease of predicted toxin-antitoxin system
LRVLLDENIPVQLKAVFHGHEVRSVNDKDVGWKNIKNGLLLTEMEDRFDLLVTADRNMYAQQNLSGRDICILVLPTNRRRDVLALGEQIVSIRRRRLAPIPGNSSRGLGSFGAVRRGR